MSELLISNIILSLVLVSFMAFHAWYVLTRDKEQREVIRGLLSKDATEYIATRPPEQKLKEQKQEEIFYPSETMTDEAFLKHIQDQLEKK